MCYPKPGPRCSGHALTKLYEAREALRKNPSDPVLRAKVEKAQMAYNTTPNGIAALRESGQSFQADIAEAKRAAQLSAYKKVVTLKEDTKVTDEQWAEMREVAEDYASQIRGFTASELWNEWGTPIHDNVSDPKDIYNYDVKAYVDDERKELFVSGYVDYYDEGEDEDDLKTISFTLVLDATDPDLEVIRMEQ